MKICNKCFWEKPVDSFELQMKNGVAYHRNTCKQCRNVAVYARKKETGAYDRKKVKQRLKRHDPSFRASFVISDAKRADRKQGLITDLSLDGVQELIEKGCHYCGEGEARIGIDRMDHTQGHTMQNINPCCTRCNFIRRTMPYAAWMLLVPAIREARETGLLDGWQAGFRHHQ